MESRTHPVTVFTRCLDEDRRRQRQLSDAGERVREFRGVRFAPGGIRKGAAGYDICFIHPKSNDEFPIGGEGVLIELVQAPAEVVAALG